MQGNGRVSPLWITLDCMAPSYSMMIAGSKKNGMSLQECAQRALNSGKRAISYSKTQQACYLLKNEKAGYVSSAFNVYRVKGGVKTPTVAVCDDEDECKPPNKWDINTGHQ